MKKSIISYCLSLFIGINGLLNPLSMVQNNMQLLNQLDTETKNKFIKESELFAKSAVLIDADSKRVLYEKNGEQVMPMASTTKIMTCILILENAALDDIVKVSQYAASMPDVQLNMKEGDQFYVKDLLYSLMLESHNDTAVALAEHVGGTVEGFATLMNQKAKELGCNNTYCITPNGLDATDETGTHSTTATDLARIMAYCIKESTKSEEFLEITQTASYTFKCVEGNQSFSCTNHNAFLSMMEGALSGKTGFTNDAGYCYVGALKKDGKTFVVALLACGWPNNKSYKWSDTKKLMKYGIEEYKFKDFSDIDLEQEKLYPIPVIDGQTERIDDESTTELKVVNNAECAKGLLMREDEEMELVYNINKEVSAPTKEGDIIGTIQYMLDGKVWKENNVIITKSIQKVNFNWCFKQVIKIFILE